MQDRKKNKSVLTDCLQGGVLVELFAGRLLFVRVGDLAQAGIGMRVAHLLEQRGGGHCIVHLSCVWKRREQKFCSVLFSLRREQKSSPVVA